MWDPYADFRKLTLSNGLDVYVSQVEREFEIFGFVIHAGAREDLPGKDGVAHFVEHCVSKGLPDLTSEDIESYFEKQGGTVKLGTTDYLKTTYMCKCRATLEHLAKSLDLFGRMLLNPDLSRGIDREREIIIQEYNRSFGYKFLPELVLMRRNSVFPGHRLTNYLRPLGNLSAIQSMTKANLEEFHNQYYVPANISIVATGKLFLEQVTDLLEKSPFDIKRAGMRNAIPPPRFPDYSCLTRYDLKGSLLLGSNNEKLLTRGQYESWSSLPGSLDPDVVIFTKNFLERFLLKKIREELGWCYGLDVDIQILQDLYEFDINIPLKIEALPHIEELVDNCISTALDDREFFNGIKEVAINDLLLIDRSYTKICEASMGDVGCYGRIIPNAETVKTREAITRDSIAEVLNYLKPEKRLTIISYP